VINPRLPPSIVDRGKPLPLGWVGERISSPLSYASHTVTQQPSLPDAMKVMSSFRVAAIEILESRIAPAVDLALTLSDAPEPVEAGAKSHLHDPLSE
jgi:hypothetical protein